MVTKMSEMKSNFLKEKSNAFVSELLELVEKYHTSGVVGLTSIEIRTLGSGRFELSYESRALVDGSWEITKHEVK